MLLANPAFAALFRQNAEAMMDRSVEELKAMGAEGLVSEQNAAVLASSVARTFEFAVQTAHGSRTLRVTKRVQLDRNQQVCGVFGVARDISKGRTMVQEIIDASDEEKQRLGRELRENFCQHLVGISLLGNVLFEELSRAGIEQAEFARQIAQLVKEVVSEVRTLEKGLSVLHLEQGEGLVKALEDLAEQVKASGEIECIFRGPSAKMVVEPQTSMYLFRIAQEAVHNALAHSQARRVEIRLAMKREAVVLSVRDDGVGFSESEGDVVRSRIGFPMMRHRSRALGAKLEIKHLRHGGIEVVCTVPRRKAPRRRR